MRHRVLLLSFSAILLSTSLFAEPQPAGPDLANFTGSEWLVMSDRQKALYMMLVFHELAGHGINIKGSPNTYIAKINEIISHQPSTLNIGLRGIIATTIYRSEGPETKAEFDRLPAL